jgi:hypothetical protein
MSRNIYVSGFQPEDFDTANIRDNFILVRAIRPELSSIIQVQSALAGNQVYCFEVLKVGGGTNFKPGNIVILRNSLLESIDVRLDMFLIDSNHVLASWPDSSALFSHQAVGGQP